MKPLFIISCPIDTYSGYGARSRDIVKTFIELNKFNIKILPQRWGNTPWGFIEDHEEWHFLQPFILESNEVDKQPEIWAQITVPNEFQPIGKYNIGITAGIETTSCDPSWVEGLNKMDLNIVPSNHSKKVFEDIKYEKRDKQTNSPMGTLKLNKPIEVLFEGIDLDSYKFLDKKEISLDLSNIKESFAFLFVGHWMNGTLGEDRKNVGLLLKTFYETFKNQKQSPALVLKVSGAGCSYMDKKKILDKIYEVKQTVNATTLPSVYVLHGELSNKEMNELYNHPKVKSMVSLTKGEGFGRPLLEFTQIKKPILATNWSGHIDFLHKNYSTLLPGEITPVHPSAHVPNIILKESGWFSPDINEIHKKLVDIFVNYKQYQEPAKKQAAYSKNRFSIKCMETVLQKYIEDYIPNFPELVELKLPELTLPELEEL